MQRLSSPINLMKPAYDVVVIGSGYGGGVAASRLARAGQSVCVIERGREVVTGEFPSRLPELRRELQINGGKTQQIDFAICFPDRCISEVAMSDELVASFKKGNQLTLTSANFQNKPNPINVALTGFSQAFDGPGLQQSEIEDRQKTLQEEVQKRKKEFEDKMKAEQAKAKAAN